MQIENPQTIKQCVSVGPGVSVVPERSVAEKVKNGMFKSFHLEDL